LNGDLPFFGEQLSSSELWASFFIYNSSVYRNKSTALIPF